MCAVSGPRPGLLDRERRPAHARRCAACRAASRSRATWSPAGPSAGTGFHFASGRTDALPEPDPGQHRDRTVRVHHPAPPPRPAHPARISLYGHGLLGSHSEVEAGNVEAMATEHNTVFCATDWWGLAEGDTGYDAARSATSTASRRSSIASSRAS